MFILYYALDVSWPNGALMSSKSIRGKIELAAKTLPAAEKEALKKAEKVRLENPSEWTETKYKRLELIEVATNIDLLGRVDKKLVAGQR